MVDLTKAKVWLLTTRITCELTAIQKASQFKKIMESPPADLLTSRHQVWKDAGISEDDMETRRRSNHAAFAERRVIWCTVWETSIFGHWAQKQALSLLHIRTVSDSMDALSRVNGLAIVFLPWMLLSRPQARPLKVVTCHWEPKKQIIWQQIRTSTNFTKKTMFQHIIGPHKICSVTYTQYV